MGKVRGMVDIPFSLAPPLIIAKSIQVESYGGANFILQLLNRRE